LSQSEANKSRITSISFNSDGRQVAIGLDDGVVKVKHQAQVVQKADNSILWINHYPADSVVCFVDTYPLNSNLSGG